MLQLEDFPIFGIQVGSHAANGPQAIWVYLPINPHLFLDVSQNDFAEDDSPQTWSLFVFLDKL